MRPAQAAFRSLPGTSSLTGIILAVALAGLGSGSGEGSDQSLKA